MTSAQHHLFSSIFPSFDGSRLTIPASFQRMRDQWLSTHGCVASVHPRSSNSFKASAGPNTVDGAEYVGVSIEEVVWKE